ncbi:DMT family transporter [Roseinatronobacter bogoriensis]|uniref:EamA/RhaT family transporter n=1 Tax=Roseinatronobacter bogoriensis subsp. barguzinensis TaxID=441209 RepID=A0A2K8K696_9RHOB|nr:MULTISPECIES: DMT family transporter [Rhodobaca]ATX64949.1 EamA/RhaT family transporter [Rhodobaca barguzinensis]MBB4208764.1 drug/metabolite transporter (DMT)-like permease [Rhodobaca bogoriensis DSM 18756]TDW37968.1 EamA-like transporter family protein [Rhodobaca barguzinensis]TDY69862.1 EamA-like transporter family protein [Rhodobaca bogoriensis DSM 18756]
MSDNLRGAVLMALAMAGFALEDMFIKLLADTLPVGQILVFLGIGGALAFGVIAHRKGQQLLSPALLTPALLLRNTAELIGTVGFVLGFVLASLATASAILQAAPLVVTLGAVLFLGEKVGWRRWTAIGIGFFGVMLIVRPGMAGFEPASLFAVIGVIGLAGRDLATRVIPRTVSSYQISSWAFAMIIPAGVFLMVTMDTPAILPSALQFTGLVAALGVGVLAYYALVASMRVGELSFVTPFRYTRMLFALIVAVLVFGERPDMLTLLGAGIIVAAGMFTLWRETKVA